MRQADSHGGRNVKKILAVTVIAMSFAPAGAFAQERVGDAALGALSGAVVLGPVGAVAGAVIGYTAGPSIARSWGVGRSGPPHRGRSARRSTTANSKREASTRAAPAQGPASHRTFEDVQGFD
jgi:hypothetical protein